MPVGSDASLLLGLAELLRSTGVDASEDFITSPPTSVPRPGVVFGAGLGTAYGKSLLASIEGNRPPKEQKKDRWWTRRDVVEIETCGIPRLADIWSVRAEYRMIVCKRWRWTREHINVLEARVALMDLKRSLRVVSGCGRIKLTLSDSLVTVGTFEKGRSSSFPLLCLCRRAAAYCIAGEVKWRLRHIETHKNVADDGSRGRESLVASPKPRPSVSHHGQIDEVDGLDSWETPLLVKLESVPEESHLLEGNERFIAGASADRRCSATWPSCSSPPERAAVAAKHTCVDSVLSPQGRGRKVSRVLADPAPLSVPVPKYSDSLASFGLSNTPYAIEIFAGSCVLTAALKSQNFRTLHPIEIQKSHIFDVSRRSTQRLLLRMVDEGLIWYAHFGTPCSVWSVARNGIKNWARAKVKEDQSLEYTLFSVAMIHSLMRRQAFFSLENPRGSGIWKLFPVSSLLAHPSIFIVSFDMCAYGQPFRNSTSVMSNVSSLKSLERRCPGLSSAHSHVHVKGGLGRKAGAYPKSLCLEWARALKVVAPAGACGTASAAVLARQYERFEEAARRVDRRSKAYDKHPSDDVAGSHYLCRASDYLRRFSRPRFAGHPATIPRQCASEKEPGSTISAAHATGRPPGL